MKRFLVNLFRPWFVVKVPLPNFIMWIVALAFFAAWASGEVPRFYIGLSIILLGLSVLFYEVFPVNKVPIHPITIILVVIFIASTILYIWYEWATWVFGGAVLLTGLTMFLLNRFPLSTEEMTDKEKEYHES